MAWTDEMVEKLKEYWAQGVTTGEIGRRLGISKNSIVGKVHRLGLEGRPSPIKRSDEVSPTKTTKKVDKKTSSAKASEKKSKTATENNAQPTSKPEVKKEKNKSPVTEPKQVAAPKAPAVSKPEPTKEVDTKLEEQINEDDIKLIKSLEVKPEKDYRKENISLTDLDNHTCRWPLGDPKDDDFHFCGRKVKTGQTYCEEHSAIAYVKPTRR